jgi:MFS family permease
MGYLCDKLGRRPILLYGFVCIAGAMAAMPFSEQFYQLVLLRAFYAQGAIAVSVVPLLADYIHPDKKGVASSLSVFMSACGALASAEINYSLLSNIQGSKIYIQYAVAASVTILVGLVYCAILVKAGNDYYAATERRTCAKLAVVGAQSFGRK